MMRRPTSFSLVSVVPDLLFAFGIDGKIMHSGEFGKVLSWVSDACGLAKKGWIGNDVRM